MILFLFIFQTTDHGLNSLVQDRQIISQNLSEDGDIHVLVGVTDDVAKVGDLPPRNMGMPSRKLCRNVTAGFRDDFQLAFDRT